MPTQCPCEWEGSMFPPGTSITKHCQNWSVTRNDFQENMTFLKADNLIKFYCLHSALVVKVFGSVRAWLALLPPLHAWSLRSHVPVGAASPLSGCVTTRTTVVTVQMRSVRPPAPQNSSAVQAGQGELMPAFIYQHHPFLWV